MCGSSGAAPDLQQQPLNRRSYPGRWETIYMVFNDFARRFAAMMVLRIPGGYDLLNPQWRYSLLFRMRLPHERDFRALPLLKFSNHPLLVDVGANIGQSVLSLYTVFPAATVVSFEPNPTVFRKLQRLTKKFPRLTVIPNGLSDRTGEAELFVPSYNGTVLSVLASFDYESAKNWLNPDTVLWFDPTKLTVLSRRLTLVRLDDCGLQPDFIKIDVQGLEYRVLAGGLETIRTYRPVIMAETIRCGSDAHKIVEPLGYRLMEFNGRSFTEVHGVPRRLNQFLIPAERLPDPS
jgi:FkbM family methyltransferase